MLKIIGSLLLISLNLFALVEANLNSQKITLGESVTLTLSASGENIVFPELIDIAGFEIESTAKSQNISIVNGKQSINISKSFTFTPTKSITIKPMSIKVDGKKDSTKELKLEVVKQNSSNGSEPNFLFTAEVDKKEAYVGEPIELSILFKRHRRAEVLDLEYAQANFPNFWSKQVGKEKTYRDGNYIVHKLTFILFPQKAGKLNIKPLKVRVATPKRSRDIFGFWVKSPHWKSMFSNDLSFNIKDIPEGIKLVGEFNIEANVDKESIKGNEPINLTLKIEGEGNLDSLEDYSLNLDGAIVYGDKAEKNFKFSGNKYKGVYSKKFAIISSENFTIPSFNLKYFDLKTKEIKEIKTKEFYIKVNGTKAKREVKLETKEEVNSTISKDKEEFIPKASSSKDKILYFMIGLFAGIVIMIIIKLIKFNFKVKEVKFSLNDRDLMKLLIPFVSKNEDAKEIVLKLEENIYYGKNHEISKKEVTKLLNEIE